MARPFYRLTSARLRFLVFLLLVVAVIAAQSQAEPQSLSSARVPAAEQQVAPLRGPLFRHVIDAGCRLGRLSWTVLAGHSGS